MRMERDRAGGGFVTGVIMAALGMETAQGDFEVIDLCFAGLPPLEKPVAPPAEERMSEDGKTWIALASGLSVGAADAPADLRAQLLVEYLTGEAGGVQVSCLLTELTTGPNG
jgi:DNA polymerase delta subunit 2